MTIIETKSRPDKSHVSTSFYKRPCARCNNGDYDDHFIGLRLLRSAGPELVIDNFDVDVSVNIFVVRPQTIPKRAREEVMLEDYHNAVYGVPSISSFARVLKRR